jgi:zinc transport system substrate-binding protein
MNSKKLKQHLVTVLCCVALTACGNESEPSNQNKEIANNDSKLHVVTTFYPMYEFTKNIAKDKANVDLLIPSSIEPHEWEPTPRDMASIQTADVLVFNSPSMETWISSVKESTNKKSPLFVEASKGITMMEGEEHDHENQEEEHHEEDGKTLDPHVWLSPVLARKEVENIEKALIKADPKNKAFYKNNANDYIKQLQELDKLYRTTLQDKTQNEIITQHAAFGYLAKEYGLTQVPIAGLSPSEEPSASKLAELKGFAKEHNIDVIFFEETTSPKVAKTLAQELDAKTEVLNTLEGLSKADQEKGLNYIEVMKNNLKSLKKALSDDK